MSWRNGRIRDRVRRRTGVRRRGREPGRCRGLPGVPRGERIRPGLRRHEPVRCALFLGSSGAGRGPRTGGTLGGVARRAGVEPRWSEWVGALLPRACLGLLGGVARGRPRWRSEWVRAALSLRPRRAGRGRWPGGVGALSRCGRARCRRIRTGHQRARGRRRMRIVESRALARGAGDLARRCGLFGLALLAAAAALLLLARAVVTAQETATLGCLVDRFVLWQVLDRCLVPDLGDFALRQPWRQHGEAVVVAAHRCAPLTRVPRSDRPTTCDAGEFTRQPDRRGGRLMPARVPTVDASIVRRAPRSGCTVGVFLPQRTRPGKLERRCT